MLLVLPVPFRRRGRMLYVEAQAANGLGRWIDNFAYVKLAAPEIPEALEGSLAGVRWVPVTDIEHRGRLQVIPLPWAYSIADYFRAKANLLPGLRSMIADSEYLQFAIGGLVGDWAAVAALEAKKMGRRYAIHTDRVEHEVMRRTAGSTSPLRRLKIAIEAPLMERYHERVIRGASLGLWHGEECFRAYSPWCRENHLIHDVHTKAADLVSPAELEAKLEEVRSAPVLRLCYTGRLDPMKAPLEWLAAVAAARAAGARVEATWFGEGALMDEAKAECARLGLGDVVRFAGFVADRAALLAEVRRAHVLMFTHVTPESPRNLLEALVCGTPIVGYANGYAAELIEEHGGGALVPVHDAGGLGRLVAELAGGRGRLAELVRAAALNGRRFSDAAVFAERSELVKRFA
jgi:glycosyltransferase involved in cell wall biosynthesis